jgi:hypothetical protein
MFDSTWNMSQWDNMPAGYNVTILWEKWNLKYILTKCYPGCNVAGWAGNITERLMVTL